LNLVVLTIDVLLNRAGNFLDASLDHVQWIKCEQRFS